MCTHDKKSVFLCTQFLEPFFLTAHNCEIIKSHTTPETYVNTPTLPGSAYIPALVTASLKLP